jgi:two-component system nitrate/nitrite response regulator NarP
VSLTDIPSQAKQGLRVLIADDHALIADAVASVLRALPDYSVVTSGTLPAALEQISAQPPFDIVLLDLRMPGMEGLRSVQTVVERAAPAKVVLFTGMVEKPFLHSALDSGVCGLIPKTMPLQSLDSVIRLVVSGQVYLPLTATMTNEMAPKQDNAGLNQNELKVLRLAADGLTNKEIARDMGVTEVTIKMHMRGICKKLGARNRAHAAMISRERLLI